MIYMEEEDVLVSLRILEVERSVDVTEQMPARPESTSEIQISQFRAVSLAELDY